MEFQLPVKNLNRLNWMLALLIGVFELVNLPLTRNEMSFSESWVYALMAATLVLLVGFGNVLILIKVYKFYNGRRSPAGQLFYYLGTYICTVLILLLLWPVFARLAGHDWAYTDFKLLATFVFVSLPLDAMVLVLHRYVLLQHSKALADAEYAQLKISHTEAANQLLKQQIHPHLLFNALNTLKSLYKKDVQAGEAYLVHLADFLRAAMADDNHKIALLADELKLCNDYLEMQQMRFGNALICEVNIPEAIKRRGYVPSFSLQPLLENAIKHNEITEESPLKISIDCEGDRVIVSNNLQPKLYKEISTGKGLANLTERYRIGSGDEVIIKDDNGVFSVSIKILSHADSDNRG